MSVLQITAENFQSEVIKSPTPVLIDFFAVWCGPCSMISPVIDQLAEEVKDIKFCKVNVDEQPDIAAAFQIASIPSLVLMKDGKVVQKAVGVRPKAQILEMLDEAR
ncbi:MAG: thioredoxin [Oscillospiraceae bacterium]|nr:thioredoxin [Oscillospiraceae bacterium]